MNKDKKSPRVVVEEVPTIKENKAASVSILWIIVPGMILLGLLMGGIIAYYTGIQKLGRSEKVSPIKTIPGPTMSASPSATPKAKIDLTKYKIKVLNGSGIKGEAGKAKDLLEKAGFVVESTGNTKTYDYQKTIIQTKTKIEENFLTALKESLTKTYEVGKNETLKDSDTSSIIIIIGSSKAE